MFTNVECEDRTLSIHFNSYKDVKTIYSNSHEKIFKIRVTECTISEVSYDENGNKFYTDIATASVNQHSGDPDIKMFGQYSSLSKILNEDKENWLFSKEEHKKLKQAFFNVHKKSKHLIISLFHPERSKKVKV